MFSQSLAYQTTLAARPEQHIWKSLNTSKREIRLFNISPAPQDRALHNPTLSSSESTYVHDPDDPLFNAPFSLTLHSFSLLDLGPAEAQQQDLISFEDDLPSTNQSQAKEQTEHQDLLRKYHAISYVCGNVQDTVPVTINGHPFPLLRSLVTALRYFRYEDDKEAIAAKESLERSGSTFGRALKKFYWADQICINQFDEVERSEQILLMRDIYSRATRTHIWLGEPDRTAIANATERNGLGLYLLDWISDKYEEQTVAGYLQREIYNGNEGLLESLGRVMALPWWSRIWTTQEAVLASQGTMHFGKEKAGWSADKLFQCMTHLQRLIYMWSNIYGPDRRDALLAKMSSLMGLVQSAHERFMYEQNEQWKGREATAARFAGRVMSCRKCDTTNPKDKVYGLLGLAPSDVAETLHADYSKSVEEVYIDWGRTMITDKSSTWYMLVEAAQGIAKGMTSMYKLPSWIPDLSNPPPDQDGGSFVLANLFRAGGEQSKWTQVVAGKVLHTRGIILDRISSVVLPDALATQPGVDNVKHRHVSWHAKINRASGLHDEAHWEEPYMKTGMSKIAALFNAVNMEMVVHRWPEIYGGFSQIHVPVFGPARRTGDADLFEYVAWRRGEKFTVRPGVQGMPVPPAFTQIHVDGAAFFMSERGYMGMASRNTIQIGDVISILPGSAVPFILRHADVFEAFPDLDVAGRVHANESNVFELVSVAYVAGIMEGELFRLENRIEDAHNVRMGDIFIA